VKERVAMLKKAVAGLGGVQVEDFRGLVIDYAHKKKAKVLIRGLRMISDFEYEFQMALTNRKLSPDIETIFLMPHESYSYLSAKLLKEASSLGADLSCFVPDFVEQALKKKLHKAAC
jgi:pantetheine-phosphate adenylyltransferase